LGIIFEAKSNMARVQILFFIFIIFGIKLGIADDAYHRYIRTQLANQFGVNGGRWMLSDNESQTNNIIEYANLTCLVSPSSGTESFTQILHLNVFQTRAHSWDNIVRFPITQPIARDDVLLLIFWINNTDSSDARHNMIFDFEAKGHAGDSPLYQSALIKPGWRQWLLPFQAKQDSEPGQARIQIHLGDMQGQFQLAGVTLINFENQYALEQLPRSIHHLEYNGQEADAIWRQKALQRIENIRTAPLEVQVVNRYGDPVCGAHVAVHMQQPAFGFGSAISSNMLLEDNNQAKKYQKKLRDLTGDGRSFNIVTLKNALKWPAWEDDYTWGSREQVRQIIAWIAEQNIKVRGHNLLWPNWENMPSDLRARSFDSFYLRDRIRNHIFDVAAFPGLQGYIAEWDVLNEILNHSDLIDAMTSRKIYIDCFRWAAAAAPHARLYINENDIIVVSDSLQQSISALKSIISELRQADAPVDGIGLQGHMGDNLTPPETLLEIFDQFAALDLDLSITEYDAVNTQEQIAADYMRDVLIAAFSHPRVRNFIMWGFWDGAHWKGDSPIFRQDWSLKPSGRVFIDYVFDHWWTNSSGTTNSQGLFSTRAFLGDYEISVSIKGHTTTIAHTLTQDAANLTVPLPTNDSSEDNPYSFRLEQNYPNPFNNATTLYYFLPVQTHICIDLYDSRGRVVKKLLDAERQAGRHSLAIDATTLANGIYFAHLTADQKRRVRKLIVVK
jgi:GH35 family endo-1,4-beta-xylanase